MQLCVMMVDTGISTTHNCPTAARATVGLSSYKPNCLPVMYSTPIAFVVPWGSLLLIPQTNIALRNRRIYQYPQPSKSIRHLAEEQSSRFTDMKGLATFPIFISHSLLTTFGYPSMFMVASWEWVAKCAGGFKHLRITKPAGLGLPDIEASSKSGSAMPSVLARHKPARP